MLLKILIDFSIHPNLRFVTFHRSRGQVQKNSTPLNIQLSITSSTFIQQISVKAHRMPIPWTNPTLRCHAAQTYHSLLGLVSFSEQRFWHFHVVVPSLTLPSKLILFRQVRITMKRLWSPLERSVRIRLSGSLSKLSIFTSFTFVGTGLQHSRRQNRVVFLFRACIHHFIGVLNPSSGPPRTSRFFVRLGAGAVLVCCSYFKSPLA